jgi:hypothetical protein
MSGTMRDACEDRGLFRPDSCGAGLRARGAPSVALFLGAQALHHRLLEFVDVAVDAGVEFADLFEQRFIVSEAGALGFVLRNGGVGLAL